LKADNQQVL